jgi:hypothetical protein
VPEPDLTVFIRRQHAAVAPGGRLIVSHYRNPGEPELDPGAALERAGYTVSGRAAAPGVSVAWTDAGTPRHTAREPTAPLPERAQRGSEVKR